MTEPHDGLITLRGSTWDHPRGYDPCVAVAAAYHDERPDVRVVWERRSLQDFANLPLEELAATYDLLVFDHPFIGQAATQRLLYPLDDLLAPATLADLAEASVGPSHVSYSWSGRQWALAVDGAAQVSAWRPDLLARAGIGVPESWSDVVNAAHALRAAGNSLALPLYPVDCVNTWLTLCANAGDIPLSQPSRSADRDMAVDGLRFLADMVGVGHAASLELNPIGLLDLMATTDQIGYCPATFGYVTYADSIRFGSLPSSGRGSLGAMLGGAGIGVSSRCVHPDTAADFVRYMASADVQRGCYLAAGGQPAHRAAWTGGTGVVGAFFDNTLSTLERAYLRPRFPGFVGFHTRLGELIHQHLRQPVRRHADLMDLIDADWRTTVRSTRPDQMDFAQAAS